MGRLKVGFLALAVISGCSGESPRQAAVSILELPRGAKDVEDLGNYWHAFTLAIAGRDRRFLRHVNRYNTGRTETLIELRD